MHFRLLGRNGFQVKAENERFAAAVSPCRQNLKYDNFTSSLGRLLFLLIQPIKSFVALSLPLQSSFLKLPFISRREGLSVMIRYSDSFA